MAVPQTLVWDHPTPRRVLAHLASLAAPASSAPAASTRLAARASAGHDIEELLGVLEQTGSGGGDE